MPDVAYCPECNQPVVADAVSCNHCGAEVGPGLDRADIWHGLRDKLAAATSDNYEVDGLIGYGGMAGVYLAKDIRLNRYVALKLITPAVLMDPKMVRRFRQEAQTMAQLNHRHIVPVYDIRESDDLLFIVMQYVPGRTLAEVVTDSRERLPPEVVATWMIQISDALAHAHGRPTAVIHRDIKPSNIILDETGEAQLTDFGIAKVQGDAGLTRTGHLIGTPAYMSPEQCRGAAITAASDQYSLGTVAYELLAGMPPFRGPTLMVLQAHSGEEPKKLSVTRPECPPALAAVVERMLAKDADERWPGMAEVSQELRKAIDELAPPNTLQAWAKRVREIGLESKPTPLTLGTSERLVARLLDVDGEELLGRRIHWASTDGGVASVTAEGVLGARGVGSAVIVGRSGAAVATVEVEVVPERPAVATVSISTDGGPLHVGEKRTAACSVSGADGAQLADRPVSWSSSDAAVIEVDATGNVSATASGSAVLTATCEGVSDSVTLEVIVAKPASDHTQVIHGIDWGPPQDLRPPVTSEAPAFTEMPELAEPPPSGQPDDDRTRVLAAAPASPPAAAPSPAAPPPPLAAPDKTNVIRPEDLAAAQGEVERAVPSPRLASPGRDLKDLIPVGILPRVAIGAGTVGVLVLLFRLVGGGGPDLPPLALSVLPADTSVEVGDEFRLRADVSAADLRARNPVWTSSDPGVAVVSQAGVVEAVGPGIVALSLRGDGIDTNGPWALTVVPAGALVVADAGADTLAEGEGPSTPEAEDDIPTSQDIPPESRPEPQQREAEPAPPPPRPQPTVQVPSRLIVESVNTELAVGQGRPISVTVVDQDGRAMAPESLTWSSSSPGAVAVDGEGTSIGVSAGSAWIIATHGSLRDSVQMTVTAPAVVEEPEPVSLGSAPTSSEAASLVAQFVAALGGDRDRVLALIPVGEQANHERYVTYVAEERLEAKGDAQDLTVDGASARFSLPVEGRTAFGGRRSGTMSFIAEFTAEGGAWTLTRVVPTPGSTPP